MKNVMLLTLGLMIAGAVLAVSIGDFARDFRAEDWRGKQIQLSEIVKNQNVLLIFSRYIGCSWCQMFIIELHNRRKDIADTNTKVIILNLSPKDVLAKYDSPEDFQFDLVPDPERKIYELYGVKLDERKITGNVLWQSIRFLKYLGGYKYVSQGLDGPHYQAPACFIIGRDGKIKAMHLGKDVADNPKVDLIISELQKLNRN